MSIDVTHFTPLASLSGGELIGAAAGLLILGAGRIMGASGIFAGAWKRAVSMASGRSG